MQGRISFDERGGQGRLSAGERELLRAQEVSMQRRESLEKNLKVRQSLCVDDAQTWARKLNSSLTDGLTTKQAEAKLLEFGPNEIEKVKPKSLFFIVLEQLNVLNMLVLIGAILCFVQGQFTIQGVQFGEKPDYLNGFFLLLIVAMCIFIGAYMEWSCSRVMADVSSMSSPSCRVVRDGTPAVIDPAQVVPGDLVCVQAGDLIPADCMVVQLADLKTNEMPLTGEPYDITKTMHPRDFSAPFPSNLLFASTPVVNGTGTALVLRTGMQTEIGSIAGLLQESEEMELTSIQRTLNQIGNTITMVVAILLVGIFMVSYHMRVNNPSDPCPAEDDLCFLQKSIMRSLFAAVGAIPESLQPACTFLLVMGCQTLKKLNASTIKLSAVDTLGSCSIVCSDKTGTLTEGKMTCLSLCPRVRERHSQSNAAKRFAFYPTRGFDPKGGVFDEAVLTREVKVQLENCVEQEGRSFSDVLPNYGDPDNDSSEARLVRSCMMALYLNSHSTLLVEDQGEFTVQGNMSEGAIVVGCAKVGLHGSMPHSVYTRLEDLEVPFSSSRKMTATVHKLQSAGKFESLEFETRCEHLAIIKGAPDVLLPYMSQVLMPDKDGFIADKQVFDASDKEWFEAENRLLTGRALRVLCVALRPLVGDDLEFLRGTCSSADQRVDMLLKGPLVLLAVIGLMDPPRASAQKAVSDCHLAGIRVAMITGDQRPTAVAVAKTLGILKPGAAKESADLSVSECSTLSSLKDESAIDELCNRVSVWSRAQPKDKVTIVESLQRQGHVVAMTGDGVNDAGALKKADIGLAMGISGTEVTKSAADIVLLDDRFATIVDAISEGRRIFENIQRMSAYLLCCNVFDVITMMAVMALGWAVPLEDAQLFKANFVTHMFYPWCMIWEPATFYNMMHPPRSRDKPLIPKLTRNMLIPAMFLVYFVCMLSAQYAGSMIYMGTVAREEQTGTTSINDFYDEETGYVCLYASTMKLEAQDFQEDRGKLTKDGAPDRIIYDRDAAPLYCRVTKLTLHGTTTFSEWGQQQKLDPDIAIQNSPQFNWFTGSWGDQFDIKNSFLAQSFNDNVQNFQDKAWRDPKKWLAKCSEVTLLGDSGQPVSGDSDKLCWTQCNDMPCWQKDLDKEGGLKMAKQIKKEEKSDEEDEPAMKPCLYKKFNVGAWSCRQMRSVVLLCLVITEMAMLYSFSKHEFSLPLLDRNRSFLVFWIPMMAIVFSFMYIPVTVFDQGFAPLDFAGLTVSFGIVTIYYFAFEFLKAVHQEWFSEELGEKVVLAELLAEGRLRAFATRDEAWLKCPTRRPSLLQHLKRNAVPHYGSTESTEAVVV
mmetsp:Transcript_64365/g.121923  ORF Transcript_64365/g.121923 Transcript_64365/m.121923 type:complete len:1322 (-) Transcript_64365:74-4039(-)